jgi:tetratricopeptide (TPR) repeat protein
MKRPTALPIALILLLLLSAQSSAKESWLKIKSKNFTVIGNAGEGDLRKLAINLEEFRHVLSLLFPRARIETPVPTTVFLFKTHNSFKPFKPQYKGKIRDNVAGYFLSSDHGNYIALTSQPGGNDPLAVIFHEYEHFVIRKNVPNAPLWLNEGLAEFFSTFKTSGDDRKASVGAPIGQHIGTLREGKFLPFETLLTVNHKSPHYNENGKVGIFYAQSWTLVHYLMLGDQQKRQAQLSKFIAGLSAGVGLEENFRQSFESDYKTLENELRSYVRKFTFPVLNLTFSKQLDFAKETEKAVMPEAEVEYYLGDLMLRGGRFDEAESHLARSLELDPDFAMSQISLGILRMVQRRLTEARTLFESAIARDPRNYLGHLHYAHVLGQAAQSDEAIASFQRAIQLKPDVAQLHSDLGYTYLSLSRDDEAIEAFKKAIQLDPRNPYLYRSRSYVYLRLARGSLAASDALIYLKRQGWQDDHSSYMALAAYFGHRQSKQPEPAGKVLEEASTKLTASEWPYPVIRYLQQRITASQLLELATDNDKLTEAHAYIGLDLSLNGASEKALPHLHWVRENGNKNFIEYPLALGEIRRIESIANGMPQ